MSGSVWQVLDWHNDSGASSLHLAVTLAGHRTLKVHRVAGAGGAAVEEAVELAAGDCYLTSPSAFAHAVCLPLPVHRCTGCFGHCGAWVRSDAAPCSPCVRRLNRTGERASTRSGPVQIVLIRACLCTDVAPARTLR